MKTAFFQTSTLILSLLIFPCLILCPQLKAADSLSVRFLNADSIEINDEIFLIDAFNKEQITQMFGTPDSIKTHSATFGFICLSGSRRDIRRAARNLFGEYVEWIYTDLGISIFFGEGRRTNGIELHASHTEQITLGFDAYQVGHSTMADFSEKMSEDAWLVQKGRHIYVFQRHIHFCFELPTSSLIPTDKRDDKDLASISEAILIGIRNSNLANIHDQDSYWKNMSFVD
ncbi:MAG: hypothetical protein AAF587_11145 [Bacteroidota bacterium]